MEADEHSVARFETGHHLAATFQALRHLAARNWAASEATLGVPASLSSEERPRSATGLSGAPLAGEWMLKWREQREDGISDGEEEEAWEVGEGAFCSVAVVQVA